jgi:ATP-binding cassette subfamily F protein uup
MAHLLGAEGLHLEFPTRIVFDAITLGIEEGDRIGIVGRNGDGKSSLLAMLAGRLEPDAGRVTVRGGTTIGVLDQADTLDDALTIGQTIVGDTPEHEWAGDAKVRGVGSRSRRCSRGSGTSSRWTSRPTISTSRRSPGSPRT